MKFGVKKLDTTVMGIVLRVFGNGRTIKPSSEVTNVDPANIERIGNHSAALN
jgi:hypothetical protein